MRRSQQKRPLGSCCTGGFSDKHFFSSYRHLFTLISFLAKEGDGKKTIDKTPRKTGGPLRVQMAPRRQKIHESLATRLGSLASAVRCRVGRLMGAQKSVGRGSYRDRWRKLPCNIKQEAVTPARPRRTAAAEQRGPETSRWSLETVPRRGLGQASRPSFAPSAM